MEVTLKYASPSTTYGPEPCRRAPFRGQLSLLGAAAFVSGSPRQNIPIRYKDDMFASLNMITALCPYLKVYEPEQVPGCLSINVLVLTFEVEV